MSRRGPSRWTIFILLVAVAMTVFNVTVAVERARDLRARQDALDLKLDFIKRRWADVNLDLLAR